MKGYFSFLMVLASVALILIHISAYSVAHSFDNSDSIAIEKSYQDMLALKGAVAEAIRAGGKSSFADYSKTHSVSACLFPQTQSICFKRDEAEAVVRNGAYQNLIALSIHPTSYEKTIWCGKKPDRTNLDNLVQSIRTNGKSLPCAGCTEFFSCSSMIIPKLNYEVVTGDYYLDSISLTGMTGDSRFGVSLYYKDEDIAVASYIPAMEVVDI